MPIIISALSMRNLNIRQLLFFGCSARHQTVVLYPILVPISMTAHLERYMQMTT